MKIYCLKTCDTCRKAIKEMAESGLSFDVVDVRKDGISRGDLERFYAVLGEDLMNKSSATWRGLDPSEREIDPVDLIAVYPTLMKRPLIETEGALYLGWKSEVRIAVLG